MQHCLAPDVDAVHSFLEAHACSTASNPEAAKSNMYLSLLAKIRKASISIPIATQLLEKIQQARWTPDQKASLQDALTSSSFQVGTSSRNATQTLLHLERYMSDEVLQCLQNREVPSRAKMIRAATLLVDLGCVSPSEKSIQACIADCVLIMLGSAEVTAMSPMCKLNMSRDFKDMVKACFRNSF